MEIPILLAAFGPNFNTSHVYINLRLHTFPACPHYMISIHLMFILIILCNRLIALDIIISIHLMFILIGISKNMPDPEN